VGGVGRLPPPPPSPDALEGAGLDQQARQHRCTRSDRECASRPGDGIGEDVTFDAGLHGWVLSLWCSGCCRGEHPATGPWTAAGLHTPPSPRMLLDKKSI